MRCNFRKFKFELFYNSKFVRMKKTHLLFESLDVCIVRTVVLFDRELKSLFVRLNIMSSPFLVHLSCHIFYNTLMKK